MTARKLMNFTIDEFAINKVSILGSQAVTNPKTTVVVPLVHSHAMLNNSHAVMNNSHAILNNNGGFKSDIITHQVIKEWSKDFSYLVKDIEKKVSIGKPL